MILLNFLFTALTLQAQVTANTQHVNVKADVLLSGLNNPWAVETSPDGRLFITEKNTPAVRIYHNGQLSAPLQGLPSDITVVGQGGLLDIKFHPKHAQNGWVFLSYSVGPQNAAKLRITRFKLVNDKLTQPKILVEGADGFDGAHFGSRFTFDKEGYLFITVGERHQKDLSQDLKKIHGKTLRLKGDGSIPTDNPYADQQGARKEIYSIGHRNSQGMDIHPETGIIFQTEHGPSGIFEVPGGDEVNYLRRKGNFGWPIIHHQQTQDGLISPLLEWTPAIAPAGAAFYTGTQIPEWKNDFFFATLRGRKLFRIRFNNTTVVEKEEIFDNSFGRLRDVTTGPDGNLYLLTHSGGRLVKISKQ